LVHLRDGAGLTLVELSVVLAIIGVLAVAAYPTISNTLQVLTSKGAAEQVTGAIRQARQYAITNGTNYCIDFQVVGTSYQYRIGQPDSSGSACDNPVQVSWTNLDGNAKVTGQTLTGAPPSTPPTTAAPLTQFDPTGRVVTTLATAPYVVGYWVDVQTGPSCAGFIGVTLYGGVRTAKC